MNEFYSCDVPHACATIKGKLYTSQLFKMAVPGTFESENK